MGLVFSDLLLLVGCLVTGVMSSVAANYARQKNWDKTKLFAGLTMGISIALILLTIFILIKSHTSFFTGPGTLLSALIMIMSMVGVTVLEILTLINASNQDSSAFWRAVEGAIASFGSFILSLIVIIFLL